MPSTATATTPAHLSSKTDNWPTPQDFFAALDAEFGFVLDACASTTNHKAASFYALDHPDEARRDGLNADWAGDADRLGGAVWMNPPYGRPIAAWMAKAHAAARSGAAVVTLVPVRADTAWWHEHVLATGAEVRYVRGRLTFGDAVNTAAFASAVVIYRPTDIAGAPGPVSTMPARPLPAEAAATVSAPASDLAVEPENDAATPRPRSSRTHRHSSSVARLDCIKCRWQSSSRIEHTFVSSSGDAPAPTAGDLRKGAAMSTTSTETTTDKSAGSSAGTSAMRRVDELTTRLVATIHDGADNPAAHDPAACLELVRATVARRGGIGRTYKREAAVQHLFSTVWQYGRFFAPGHGWTLIEAAPEQASLRWRRHDAQLDGDVLDVISAAGHPDVAALPRPGAAAVRLCNLANRSASLVWLSGTAAPQPWSASVDPMTRPTTTSATPAISTSSVAVAA